MSKSVSEGLVEEVPVGTSGEALAPGEPQITFRGNTYDLISLSSLITGALVLFSCLTCNMGYYCLPLISVALGAVSLLSVRQAVEAERTRLWSWLGIAMGGIVLLLIVACAVLYIGFIILAIVSEEWG